PTIRRERVGQLLLTVIQGAAMALEVLSHGRQRFAVPAEIGLECGDDLAALLHLHLKRIEAVSEPRDLLVALAESDPVPVEIVPSFLEHRAVPSQIRVEAVHRAPDLEQLGLELLTNLSVPVEILEDRPEPLGLQSDGLEHLAPVLESPGEMS